MIRVPDPNHHDLVAKRIIAAESFLLALCVAIDGWTPLASLRLMQIAAAVQASHSWLPASRRR